MRRLALLFSCLLLLAAPAGARQLVIESFTVEVHVNADGVIDVTETIRPRFTGQWNGIYRSIPVEYRTPQGFNYSLLLEPLGVAGEGGALRYETSRERHYLKFKIWVPGAEDATRTVVLRYRVLNGLRFFEEHDELYWNITGDEWEVPIESASARIILPAGATGVRALAFTGSYGAQAQEADVEITANEVKMRMRRRLAFREGLTAVVGWDKGLVHEPSAAAKGSMFLRSNWPLLIPLVVFALMFWLWATRGRDPRLRPIAAQYAPPEGLTPAEAGTLIDNKADMRDITATIVDLAVRGHLLIEEIEEAKLLGIFGSGKEYVFHRRQPKNTDDKLKPHERELFDSLFSRGSSDKVELSELENKFYKDLPGIRDAIFEALLARRYYAQRPDKVKRRYIIAAIVVGAVSIWGVGFLTAATGLAPGAVITAGLLSAASILGFGWFMPARTFQGASAVEKVIGFEEFLSRVESDRFERMVKTPAMFEKFLPFAMAFGVENNWVKAFEEIYRQPPEWYRGPAGRMDFHPRSFVSDLGRMSTRAAAVMASAPRSSGGSGFGGGGFSGGGFGGGGGGGF